MSTVPGEGHGRRGPVQPFVDEIQASTAGGFWPFGKPPAKVWGAPPNRINITRTFASA